MRKPAGIAVGLRPALHLLAAWAAAMVVCPAAAQEKQEEFDPAALAKTVAPFIDEQAILVARIDPRRIAVAPLAGKVAEWLPDQKAELTLFKTVAAGWTQAFLSAGGRDAYAVFTLSPGTPVRPPLLVIPLRPGSDEKAIRAIFPGSKGAIERVGDALVVADHRETLEWVRTVKPDPRPELAAAFEAAGKSTVQVLVLPPKYTRRVIEEAMPQLPNLVGGGPSSVLTRGFTWAAIGIDGPPRMALRVVVKSQDAQAAEALRTRWLEFLRFAGQQKEVREFLPTFDEAAKLLVPRVEGDRLVAVLSEENKGISNLLTVLQPVIGQAQAKARRAQSLNNLKMIALAVYNFHDRFKRFPAAATYGPDGKPLLSWRVHILPYLAQGQLYKEFHLSESWDSPHNKALIEKMPPVFRSPMSKLKEKGRTNYVVAVGPGTVFGGREGMKISDIKDGTSMTIMTVEVADQHAVVWTKPDDLPFDPKEPAKGLGGLYEGGFNAGICDGSVHFIPLPQPDETLRCLFQAADGKYVRLP